MSNLLTRAAKGIKKVAGNVEKATVKGVKDTGHEIGKDAKSKIGQVVIGAAIASTGVGLLTGAAIGAGVKSTATLIAPHGNLRKAGRAIPAGAAAGAAGVAAGAAVRTIKDGGGFGGFSSRLLHGKGASVPITPSPAPIIPDLPPARITPTLTDPAPITSSILQSGIVPTTLKERPVDAVVDTLASGVTRKKTPSDTHGPSRKNAAQEVQQQAQPVIDQSSGGGGGGGLPPVADAPSKFSPMAAIAAVAVAIVVGMFALKKHGAR